MQGHRRGRCSGRPETVRHTHCSERVGMCQRLSSRRDNDVRGGRVRTHGHAGKACGTTSWRATPRASPLQTLSPLVALHNPTHGDGTCRSSRRTSGAAVSTPRPLLPRQKAPGVQGHRTDTTWINARTWAQRPWAGAPCSAPRKMGRTGGTVLATSPWGSGWLGRVGLPVCPWYLRGGGFWDGPTRIVRVGSWGRKRGT